MSGRESGAKVRGRSPDDAGAQLGPRAHGTYKLAADFRLKLSACRCRKQQGRRGYRARALCRNHM
jgi:hypothetical protein